MASRDLLRSLASLELRAYARSDLFEKRHLRRVENLDSVFLEDFLDLGGNVGVFAQNQPRIAVHDRHARTEPSEHLAELKSYVATAEHDEMLGQLGQLHDARGIEEANRIEPRDWRHGGPAACIDYDALAPELARATAFQFHDDALRALESGLAEDQFDIGGFLERLLNVVAEALDHAALALVHPTHVHRHGTGADAVIFRAPSEISDASAGQHGLGRRAADVDAGAADVLALDHRDLPACASERQRERLRRLPGANDDCVELSSAHGASFGQYNRGMLRIAAFVFAAVLAAAPTRAQDEQLVDQAKKRWAESPHGQMLERILPPTFELHQLPERRSRGARLVVRYCVQCHNLPNPAMHQAAKWPAIFERMVVRMRGKGNLGELMQDMMAGVEAPTTAEAEILLAYLQKYSQRPLDPNRYPAVNLPEGRSFKLACQQCHVLPDPQRHKASEWPAVVARMEKNMQWMSRVVGNQPDSREIQLKVEEINAFLVKYARKE